eukprot:6213588-Pleurochrysis_carterae.AAC.1
MRSSDRLIRCSRTPPSSLSGSSASLCPSSTNAKSSASERESGFTMLRMCFAIADTCAQRRDHSGAACVQVTAQRLSAVFPTVATQLRSRTPADAVSTFQQILDAHHSISSAEHFRPKGQSLHRSDNLCMIRTSP